MKDRLVTMGMCAVAWDAIGNEYERKGRKKPAQCNVCGKGLNMYNRTSKCAQCHTATRSWDGGIKDTRDRSKHQSLNAHDGLLVRDTVQKAKRWAKA